MWTIHMEELTHVNVVFISNHMTRLKTDRDCLAYAAGIIMPLNLLSFTISHT